MEGREKEEEKKRLMMVKNKFKETEISPDDIKRQEAYNMSPRTMGMTKSSSVRQNCLCAPTTHPGSFRCRYHRRKTGLGMPRGISVPTNLSMLSAEDDEIGGASSTFTFPKPRD